MRRTVLGIGAAVAAGVAFVLLLGAGLDPALTWAITGVAYCLLILIVWRWRR